MPLYIFDLDGTLALIDHRRHLVEGAPASRNWPEFHRQCVNDQPNWPVIDTMESLRRAGASVYIFSGRSEEVRAETIDWLVKYTSFTARQLVAGTSRWPLSQILWMRAAGDFTPDEVLKLRWLQALPESDRARLAAIFDDRDKVVKMWRANNLPCFQVAPGPF